MTNTGNYKDDALRIDVLNIIKTGRRVELNDEAIAEKIHDLYIESTAKTPWELSYMNVCDKLNRINARLMQIDNMMSTGMIFHCIVGAINAIMLIFILVKVW